MSLGFLFEFVIRWSLSYRFVAVKLLEMLIKMSQEEENLSFLWYQSRNFRGLLYLSNFSESLKFKDICEFFSTFSAIAGSSGKNLKDHDRLLLFFGRVGRNLGST